MRSADAVGAAASSSSAAPSGEASWVGVSSAMKYPLLNDHLFQEHVAHMIGRGGGVDPPEQFFLQSQYAFRAFEIVDAQFAQIGLELVHQTRRQRRDAGFFQVIVHF